MKCPNCGFNSFDYLDECPKCKLPLNPSPEYKALYRRALKGNKAKAAKEHKSVDVSDNISENKDLHVSTVEESSSYEMTAASVEENNVPVYTKTKVADREEIRETDKTLDTPKEDISHGDEIDRMSDDPDLYSESLTPEEATNQEEQYDENKDSESYSIATLKTRAAAFVIDLLVVGLISYIAIEAGFYLMSGGDVPSLEVQRIFLPIYILLFFLASTYFIFLHYYAGTTVGKMIFGIKIISSDGSDIGLWESFMRWVGYYISAAFLFAGFVWSIFDRHSQAWHDKIAGTYVVKG